MRFHEWKVLYFDSNLTEVFLKKGPINDKSAMVKVMAWRRTGDKPLPEPVITQFYWRIYMRH